MDGVGGLLFGVLDPQSRPLHTILSSDFKAPKNHHIKGSALGQKCCSNSYYIKGRALRAFEEARAFAKYVVIDGQTFMEYLEEVFRTTGAKISVPSQDYPSVKTLADKIGRSGELISKRLRLLTLPEDVQKSVEDGTLLIEPAREEICNGNAFLCRHPSYKRTSFPTILYAPCFLIFMTFLETAFTLHFQYLFPLCGCVYSCPP